MRSPMVDRSMGISSSLKALLKVTFTDRNYNISEHGQSSSSVPGYYCSFQKKYFKFKIHLKGTGYYSEARATVKHRTFII